MKTIKYTIKKEYGKVIRTIKVKDGKESKRAGKYLYGRGLDKGQWTFTDDGDYNRFRAWEEDYAAE